MRIHPDPDPGQREGQFRGQKSRGPLEISREMAHYVVCPKQQKNNIPNFQNQQCIGIFMYRCDHMPKNFLFIVDNRFLIVLKMF